MSDFVESIYALNLLAFSMGEGEIASLYLVDPDRAIEKVMAEVVKNVLTSLILLSPIVLVIFKKNIPTILMIVLGEMMIICRIIEPLVPPRAKMFISGLGVGGFLLFFPILIQKKTPQNAESESLVFGIGIAFALASSILLRTLSYGTALSTYRMFQVIGWILGGIAAVMIWSLRTTKRETDAAQSRNTSTRTSPPARVGKIIGLCLGMIGIFTLFYFVFCSPTVVARWTEGNYIIITTTIAVMATVFILYVVYKPDIISRLPRWIVWLWNMAFVITLFITIVVHQIPFPSARSEYPITAAAIVIPYK